MDCIFCKIIRKDVPAAIVYENEKIIAFLDISPINKGHTLVISRDHHKDILDTPDDVVSELIQKTKKIASAVIKTVGADGFNIGVNTGAAAGQSVFHTHLHIIPRFEGDGLKPWPHQQLSEEVMKQVQDAIASKLKECF